VRHFKAALAALHRASESAFSWPNSSDAIKEEGIDAQFTLMKPPPERCECCRWREQSVLSLPVSPVISTVESVGPFDIILRARFAAL